MELQEDQESSSYSQSEDKRQHNEQKAFLHEVENADEKYGKSLPLVVGVIAVAIVLVEIILSWVLVGSTRAKITNAESRINDANRQLSNEKTNLAATEKYATGLNNAFTTYNQEISKDKDLIPLWDELKTVMVPNTRLKAVSIDDKGTIKLEGEAKSYVDVANLIASINKKSQRLTKVNLVNLISGTNVKSFGLTATYNPPKDSTISQSNGGAK